MTPWSGQLARLRLFSLCFLALSVSLGVALVSLAKLVLLVTVLLQLISDVRQRHQPLALEPAGPLPWPSSLWWGAAALLWMALSITWASAPAQEAGSALARHARWLVLPAAFYLLRAGTPAWPVLQCLVATQVFVLLSAWLMVFGIPLPWAISPMEPQHAVVFTSTIEQPIMNSLMMLVVWYFRDRWPLPNRRLWVWAVMVLTSAHVLLVVPGRTGQLALLLAWALILWDSLPRRLRWLTVLVPVLLAAIVGLGSERMQERWLKVKTDVVALQSGPLQIDNSMGYRIDAWHKSAQALGEMPPWGHGVGGWRTAYLAQGGSLPNANDPHQQFLLWAVESGWLGVGLFMGFLIMLWRNAQALTAPASACLRAVVAIEVLSGMANSTLLGAGMGEFFLLLWATLLACHQPPDTNRSQGFLAPSQ